MGESFDDHNYVMARVLDQGGKQFSLGDLYSDMVLAAKVSRTRVREILEKLEKEGVLRSGGRGKYAQARKKGLQEQPVNVMESMAPVTTSEKVKDGPHDLAGHIQAFGEDHKLEFRI